METRRDVFQAIADPIRREIIDLLVGKPMNLNAIADKFDVSRPAISNHIKILNECGIVIIEQIGRERHCKIDSGNLREVADWIGKYNDLWEGNVNAFEKYLYKLKTKRTKHGRKK